MGNIDNGRDNITRHKLSSVVPLSIPYNIQIEPQDICNFHCEYCIHSALRNDQFTNVMEWDGFELLVQQLKDLSNNYKIINLIGYGEPLAYKHIVDMVEVLSQAHISNRIEITTNASLLTHEKADALIKAGLTRLIVSLQGLNADKYKKICGFSLEFDKFIESIQYFYKHRGKCKLHLKIADTALEEGDSTKFYQLFGDMCDDLYIEHIIPVFKEINYEDKLKQISRISGVNRYGYEYQLSQVCPQPFYQILIKANGDVAPCCMYPSPFILGNIYKNSLKDIWNGKRHQLFMKLQLEKKRDFNAICRDCINPAEASHPLDNMDADSDVVLKKIQGLEWRSRNV